MFYSNKDYFGFARFNWNFYSDIDIQDIDILVIFIYVDSPGWCVFRGSLQPWVHWTPKFYHISIYLSIYILSYLSIYLSKNSLMILFIFLSFIFQLYKVSIYFVLWKNMSFIRFPSILVHVCFCICRFLFGILYLHLHVSFIFSLSSLYSSVYLDSREYLYHIYPCVPCVFIFLIVYPSFHTQCVLLEVKVCLISIM